MTTTKQTNGAVELRRSKPAATTEDSSPEAPDGSDGAIAEGEFVVDDAIPSTAPGDVGSFEEFLADDDDVVLDDAHVLYVSVGRPENDAYVRTYHDRSWWKDIYVFEHKGADGKKLLYLVSGALRQLEELEGKVKKKRMVPYITMTGAIGLWPIGIEAADNPWVASAMRACEEARTTWTMVVSRREIGQNKARPANKKHADPVWPKLTFGEMIDLAFLPERRITPENYRTHPVMCKIRGE
jgi:hypothetical protein